MTQPLGSDHPLRRLFSGAVQHALYVDVGVCDPPLADYLADLLSNLIHVNDIYPFHDATGRRLVSLAEWLTDAELKEPTSHRERQRVIHKHIGDFSLFWTGLFPEGLRRLQQAGAADQLSTFLAQGKRSYSIASELTGDGETPPRDVLQRLSDRYEYCMMGLNICRRGWANIVPPLAGG